MNLEFFVHGVPYGHCIWNGDSVSDSFINNFYVDYKNVKEQVRLVVDIARKGNAVSSYYTYLRTCNYSDSEGRTGSFFGMTLRFDGHYCREVAHVYNILNEAYERTIVGNIIESRNGVSKYRISDFKQADNVLKKLCADLFARLDNSMFLPIDSSFTGRDAKRVEAFNPADTGSPAFFDSLKQSFKAYVSPEYATRSAVIDKYKRYYIAEHESVEQERRTSAARQQQIDELSQRLGAEQDRSAKLQRQIDDNQFKKNLAKEQQKSLKLEEENQILRQQNEELSSRELRLNDEMYDRIETLSAEMKKMRKILREVGSRKESSTGDKNDRGNESRPRIFGKLRRRTVMWIVIAAVLVATVCIVHSCNDEPKDEPKSEQVDDPKNGKGSPSNGDTAENAESNA